MKHSFLKSALLLIAAVCSTAAMAEFQTIEINFMTSTYTLVTPATLPTGVVVSGTARGDDHGYNNVVVTVPAEAGNYKVTIGACSYGNGAGNVTGSVSGELATFNQKLGDNMCYHQSTTTNIVTVTFTVAASENIIVTCGQYTPYFKIEKLAVPMYTVTFVNETAGVEGTVPAPIQVAAGSSITLPLNRTLYKEGYTLTAWEGNTMFSPGTLFEPTGNTELKAAFAANASDFLTASSELTVTWDLQTGQGAPTLALEGASGNGFLVAQTQGAIKADVKMSIDATATGSKCNNASWTDWCQVNANTAFSFPSKAGATVEALSMNEPLESKLDGVAYTNYSDSYVAEYTTTNTSGTSVLLNGLNTYYRWIKLTLPASSGTGIDTVTGNPSPVTEKVLRDGQLFIIRDGHMYNALGAEVK